MMATLKLEVPEALYQALEKQAQAHRRSLKSEAIFCLEQSLTLPPLDVEAWIEEVRNIRQDAGSFFLTDALFDESKRR